MGDKQNVRYQTVYTFKYIQSDNGRKKACLLPINHIVLLLPEVCVDGGWPQAVKMGLLLLLHTWYGADYLECDYAMPVLCKNKGTVNRNNGCQSQPVTTNVFCL